MCTRPIAKDTTEESEHFRIGGVRMSEANRKTLPAAILVMAELVASYVILMDDEDEDWFASRFWEGCDVIASALRKFDKDDPRSVK